jgi:hypothetical protein
VLQANSVAVKLEVGHESVEELMEILLHYLYQKQPQVFLSFLVHDALDELLIL